MLEEANHQAVGPKKHSQVLLERVETIASQFVHSHEEYSSKLQKYTDEINLLNNKLSMQEEYIRKKADEIEKNNYDYGAKFEEAEQALNERDLELKELAEKLESIEVDRRQRYSEIETLRRS